MPITFADKDLELIHDAIYSYQQMLIEYNDDDYEERYGEKVERLSKLLARSCKALGKARKTSKK